VYGLTVEEDQTLDFASKKSKLEDQLQHISRARRKEINGKKGLEKLVSFYQGDTAAQQRTLEELAAIDERLEVGWVGLGWVGLGWLTIRYQCALTYLFICSCVDIDSIYQPPKPWFGSNC
jgi:hypothetical protein